MLARKLPFVIQPRVALSPATVGTEESGQISIQRRGYITVGEKALTQEAMKGFHAVADLYSLVQEIAEDVGKPPADVLVDLSTAPAPDYLALWQDAALARLEAVQIENTRRAMVQATAILISRIDSDWTIEDTMQLHPGLVEAISDFYVNEEKGAEGVIAGAEDNTGAEGKE